MATKLARRDELIGSGPVRYRVLGPADAPSGFLIAIDYTDAPVPEHYYVADYAYVANIDPQVLFVFGKWDRSETQQDLRNKIEILFPALYFVHQLWKSSRDFHKLLRKFVEGLGYEVPAISSSDVRAEKVQTFYSNNVLMVLSGGEAMVDFFYLSPRDVYLRTRKKQSIELEALVRVVLAPTLLLSLMDACEPIAEKLKERFPEEEGENEIVESD